MPTPRCGPCARTYDEDFAAEAELLKAIADPHRMTIVATLARSADAVCVCDFTEGMPINQSSVSHHLAILRDAGIVTSERRGTWAYYSLAPDVRDRLLKAIDGILPSKRKLKKAS
ncbi:MAG: ArsR/SmtB family transcription factor [Vulcanimicrobiaceae bacterium]